VGCPKLSIHRFSVLQVVSMKLYEDKSLRFSQTAVLSATRVFAAAFLLEIG